MEDERTIYLSGVTVRDSHLNKNIFKAIRAKLNREHPKWSLVRILKQEKVSGSKFNFIVLAKEREREGGSRSFK